MDKILAFLEKNIDTEHIDKMTKEWRRVHDFKAPESAYPLIINYPNELFSGYPYGEAFENMEKMLYNELCGQVSSIQLKDGRIPCIRANYGVGILASLFGARSYVIGDSMPWVDPLPLDEVRNLLHKGIPDIKSELAVKVFDTISYYKETLKSYPKLSRYIPIYHPDLQGPFDTAHLIIGSDIYIYLYEEPELIHELMRLIAETYIVFLKAFKKEINDEQDGFCHHWGGLFSGSVVLRNDSAVNISREQYEEFVKPYDDMILSAFNGGSMHFCGRADQWVFSLLESENLGSVNFGQLSKYKFSFDLLEFIRPACEKRGISVVNYYMDNADIVKAVQSDYARGTLFTTSADDIEHAVKIKQQIGLV